MAEAFPLDFFGAGDSPFNSGVTLDPIGDPGQSFWWNFDPARLDANSEFLNGGGGANVPDSTGYLGGLQTLLGDISSASETLFGAAGRTFDAFDQLAARFSDGAAQSGGAAPVVGGGGLFDGPLVPLVVIGGVAAALWFVFR